MDLTGIRAIGIDEIHRQRGSHFLTLVYQIDPCALSHGASIESPAKRRRLQEMRLITVLAMVLLPFQPAAQSVQDQKTEILIIDGKAPPPSLVELSEESDLVGVMRVEGAAAEFVNETVVTTYTMIVTRLVHTSQILRTGDKITVRIPGGSTESLRVINDKVPPLAHGGEYLLFLKQHYRTGGYTIPYGSSAIFTVIHGLLQEHSNQAAQRVYASERGRPVEQVLRALMRKQQVREQ